MGGLDMELPQDLERSRVGRDLCCHLCKHPYREPFSGTCKHPFCKSCLVVHFTRDLPAISGVLCDICDRPLKLSELKRDQVTQRKLQKQAKCKCRNCDWKGSYTDYIENHERVCGNVERIQCKVFGCGKWLPKNRALELHRADNWCPMILLMKTRLTQAEILHLSMRESWEWTCGLVLRSESPAVRTVIKRLEEIFGVLDPTVPVALDNDEYTASAKHEITSMSSDGSKVEYITDNKEKELAAGQNRSSTSMEKPDARSGRNSFSNEGGMSTFDAQGAAGMSSGQTDRHFSHVQPGINVTTEIRRVESDVKKASVDIASLSRNLDNLKNLPRAFAALSDKFTLLEGVIATVNNDVISMNMKMDNFPRPGKLAIVDEIERVVFDIKELQNHVLSLAQAKQKMETRILDLECSYSGVFLWKIDNYSQRKKDAATTNKKSIYSPPFFTSQYGYKLCGRVFLIGDGVGIGTHISLFLTIMRGPYDAVVPWPFKEKITFQLVNQADPVNRSIVESFRPDPTSSSFKRPTSDRNIGAGCPLFVKIQQVEDLNQGFLKDDILYLKIISQTYDVPEFK
ncbi:uncharacterized protein [Diadema antillarum]|uniref:uncharacterized protein n=1 Tax=Diadema antillarum TaxID=105358 RepID=UPI003A849948